MTPLVALGFVVLFWAALDSLLNALFFGIMALVIWLTVFRRSDKD